MLSWNIFPMWDLPSRELRQVVRTPGSTACQHAALFATTTYSTASCSTTIQLPLMATTNANYLSSTYSTTTAVPDAVTMSMLLLAPSIS